MSTTWKVSPVYPAGRSLWVECKSGSTLVNLDRAAWIGITPTDRSLEPHAVTADVGDTMVELVAGTLEECEAALTELRVNLLSAVRLTP